MLSEATTNESTARQRNNPDSDTRGSDRRSFLLVSRARDLIDTCKQIAVQLQLRDYPSPLVALGTAATTLCPESGMNNEGKTREGKVLERGIDCSVAVFGSTASSHRAHLMTRARARAREAIPQGSLATIEI